MNPCIAAVCIWIRKTVVDIGVQRFDKLRKHKDMFVATETVAKICDELEFGVGDSLEFTKD